LGASSTTDTLKNMLVITLIGLPFVIIYTINVHRIFKGVVKADEEAY